MEPWVIDQKKFPTWFPKPDSIHKMPYEMSYQFFWSMVNMEGGFTKNLYYIMRTKCTFFQFIKIWS